MKLYLYHYTHWRDLPSIEKHGLTYRFRDEDWSDTLSINVSLEKNRPQHLPSFINRDECVFFYPNNRWKCGVGDVFYRVHIKHLDKSRLFVASLDAAQEIYEHNSSDYYASVYWNSLQPFSEQWVESISNNDMRRYEVLYFGEIPFSLMEVGCSIFPETRKIISQLLKNFHVETWSDRYRRVMVDDVYYNIYFGHDESIQVTTDNGSFDCPVFSFLESYFQYEQKEISYNGELRIRYQDIQYK